MPLHDDEPIWYACYGSNCRLERFEAYLHGGFAEGTSQPEPGARDPRSPARSGAFWFPMPVRYIGDRPKWGGGGIAFLDHEQVGRAPGRRYLITKGQFDDVVAQESGRDRAPIDVDRLETGVMTARGDGGYDGILALEPIDGIPVITFTSPRSLADRPTNPPSPAYLGTILRGLLEVHDGGLDEIVEALLASPGVSDGWTAAQIAALAEK